MIVGCSSPLPSSFSLEVTCTWRVGDRRSGYGVTLGVDKNRYLSFDVTREGHARAGLVVDGSMELDLMPWRRIRGVTSDQTVLRLEVRSGDVEIFVNDLAQGSLSVGERISTWKAFGLTVFGEQTVTFHRLALIARAAP